MLNWTRGLYVTSMILALLIGLGGTFGKDDNHMLLAVVIPYLLWFTLLTLFVWSSLNEIAKESEFFMSITGLHHLLCVGTTMAFFDSLLGKNDDTFFLWMPIAIQVGIFLAVSLQECAVVLLTQARVLLLRLLLNGDGLRRPTYENNWAPYHPQYA